MTAMITPVANSTSQAEEVQVIPNEAIRLRILANSNQESDQELKRAIRDEVNKEINTWVAELTSIEEARKVISSRLPEIEAIAKEVMEKEKNVQTIDVDFGETVFPTKLYGQYLYPAGKYEAIKITLGEGDGENWWCVLFPPLCFLDFNSGTAVANASSTEEAAGSEESPANQASEETVVEKTEVEQLETEQEVADETKTDSTEFEHVQAEEVDDKQTAVEQANPEQQISDEQTIPTVVVAGKQAEAQEEQNDAHSLDKEFEKEASPPVYESQDEEPVKVKFFLAELVENIF